MRQSPELQREHARDLICAWALATEALIGTCDPDTVELMFNTARDRASGWSDERRAAELQAVLSGELTATIFNSEFVQRYRRDLLGGAE
jgi:hypothetical protein